jgi:hypothetical protein
MSRPNDRRVLILMEGDDILDIWVMPEEDVDQDVDDVIENMREVAHDMDMQLHNTLGSSVDDAADLELGITEAIAGD